MEGKGKKNLDLARKSGQEGAAVTYKSVAVMKEQQVFVYNILDDYCSQLIEV